MDCQHCGNIVVKWGGRSLCSVCLVPACEDSAKHLSEDVLKQDLVYWHERRWQLRLLGTRLRPEDEAWLDALETEARRRIDMRESA